MDFITIADEPYADEMLNFELAPERRLALFLDSVFDLLRIAAQSRFLILPLGVREAWYYAILELDDDRLAELRSMLDGERARDYDFRRAGLTGPELHAKLAGYANARTMFHARGGLGHFRSAIRWAKSILGSLAKELPFAEFLLELIEFIENAVHDTEDIR